MATQKVKTISGRIIEYEDSKQLSGTMKIVYFTKDKKEVVAFYKERQDAHAYSRLKNIVEKYNPSKGVNGNYWKELFCWPSDIIQDGDRLGLVAPVYPNHFFFSKTKGKQGKEKNSRWFTSSWLRKMIDIEERGNFRSNLAVCLNLARAIRRLHASGLAHSDLSNNNVLIDPVSGKVAVIDIDGLVVPGKYPPDVEGTRDYFAPEVLQSNHLPKSDKNRILPSRLTDLHALAVLLYMYLLHRHPLTGIKTHSKDPDEDDKLSFGEKALFIEHPSDKSNPPEQDTKNEPWCDIKKIPYTVTGPYLTNLFKKAFVESLHSPAKRPTANEWEKSFIKTIDLLVPCENNKCEGKWFVYDSTRRPICPFCGNKSKLSFPVINFLSSHKKGNYSIENHRLIVYNGLYLYRYHTSKRLFPDESLDKKYRETVGYFSYHNKKWVFVNQNLKNLYDISNKKKIAIGELVILKNELQLAINQNDTNARLFYIQMT